MPPSETKSKMADGKEPASYPGPLLPAHMTTNNQSDQKLGGWDGRRHTHTQTKWRISEIEVDLNHQPLRPSALGRRSGGNYLFRQFKKGDWKLTRKLQALNTYSNRCIVEILTSFSRRPNDLIRPIALSM